MLRKFLSKYLLRISWKTSFGTRLKYHLKKTPYQYKKLGRSITLYETEKDPLSKTEWKEKLFFNRVTIQNKQIVGIADPFLIEYTNKLYVFFEAINEQKGEIWVAEYGNGTLENPKCILKKNTHLSYPNVFLKEATHYMIPENYQEGTVCLYTSKAFPYSWKLDTVLYTGKKLVDTNMLEYEGLYYWFTYDLEINKSRIFYSDTLRSTWIEHPQSPFSSNRNAGPFIFYKETIIHPIQVSKNSYGEGVSLMCIEVLNTKEFKEVIFDDNFLKKENGFTLDGTHHISVVHFNSKTYIAIDGKNNNFYSIV